MTATEVMDKLDELSGKQGQAVDALCLLLDSLEHEGRMVTQGPGAAENFVSRLRVYMGALHLVADTFEDTFDALDKLSGQVGKGAKDREDQV